MEDKRYIFISYKRENAPLAALLRTAFKSSGFEVWFDADVQGGQKWASVIDDNLANAGCVVVVWSELANASPWVRHEASHAMTRNVYAPCRIEMVPIPVPYNHVQATDLLEWNGEPNHLGFCELLKRVRELLPPIPSFSQRVRAWLSANRLAILASGVAAIALALLAWQTFSIRDQLGQSKEQLSQSKEQLAQLAELTKKQESAAGELDRALHPLGDLTVQVTVKLPTSDSLLADYRSKLEKRLMPQPENVNVLDSEKLFSDGMKLHPRVGGVPERIEITRTSPYYPEFGSFENSAFSVGHGQIAIFKVPIEPSSFDPFVREFSPKPDLEAKLFTSGPETEPEQQRLPFFFHLDGSMNSLSAGGHLRSRSLSWITSGKVVSIKDLSNAQIFLSFGSTGFGKSPGNARILAIRRKFEISELGLRFGVREASLDPNRLTAVHGPQGTYWTYTLPANIDALFK
jgi:hypothetical protein